MAEDRYDYDFAASDTYGLDDELGDNAEATTMYEVVDQSAGGGGTLYTWIKYASDDQGTGITDDPTGMTYIGIAYNKTEVVESTNPEDYTWSLFKGDQGVAGQNGENGQTMYTWIKYADDSAGTGMNDLPDGKTYIGISTNQTSPTESTNPLDYTWSLIKGSDGVPDKGTIGSVDWNTLVNVGIYKVNYGTGAKPSNFPSGATGDGVLTILVSGTSVTQVYTTFASPSLTYTRTKLTSTWGTWDESSKLVNAWKGTGTSINGGNIQTGTIVADAISVTNLSALSTNLGTVSAGSITSNTTIDVGTNLKIGQNIHLQYDYADRFNDKGIIFYDGVAHGTASNDARITSTYLIMNITNKQQIKINSALLNIDVPTVNTYVGGNFNLQGTTNLNGQVNVNDNLTVATGYTTTLRNTTIVGTLTCNNITQNSGYTTSLRNTTITGTLSVSSTLTASASIRLNATRPSSPVVGQMYYGSGNAGAGLYVYRSDGFWYYANLTKE